MNSIASWTCGPTIAAAMLTLLALGTTGQASAATIPVTNCRDDGAGSLREAVRIALSGDTINLRNLTCPKITLTSGAIVVPQLELDIQGPGFRKVSVSGNLVSSVFRHTALHGAFKLSGIRIEDGVRREPTNPPPVSPRAEGGCIYSNGDEVTLYDVEVRNCSALGRGLATNTTIAQGGGIYAPLATVTASYSGIYSNTARGLAAAGGGILASKVLLYRTRIHHNWSSGYGGGFVSFYGTAMNYSTVSHNRSRYEAGGFSTDYFAQISNSTISNNKAGTSAGGFMVWTFLYPTFIVNSTISGNVAPSASAARFFYGAVFANSTVAFNRRTTTPGQEPSGALSIYNGDLFIDSTIVADNTVDGQPDIDILTQDPLTRIIGANNLVMDSNGPLPADTLHADPMLGPLADNGGRTWTHALLDGSPAIDQGNNEEDLPYDQRGVGFPRAKGARADIGAFEW